MNDVRTDERVVSWRSEDGHTTEVLRLGYENGGWTADGLVTLPDGRVDVHYVVRTDDAWNVRQVLLFRDLDEPDLWLAHDGRGRWGEVNGASRDDLEGCTHLDLVFTPFGPTIAIRRHGLAVGGSVEHDVASLDHDTLQVVATSQRLSRLTTRRWRIEMSGGTVEVDVDDDGFVIDHPTRFRRISP